MKLLSQAFMALAVLAGAPPAHAGCPPALDPQMVHYVPVTPSSGPNSLFRLIGARARDSRRLDPRCSVVVPTGGSGQRP